MDEDFKLGKQLNINLLERGHNVIFTNLLSVVVHNQKIVPLNIMQCKENKIKYAH